MKKFILLFFPIAIFLGCEKEFDTIIDFNESEYQVTGISSFQSFTYIPGDSSITINITFNNSSGVNNVFADIISSDDDKLNNAPLTLLDNGNSSNGDAAANDDIFSARFPLSQSYPNGQYTIKYFVTDSNQKTKQAAAHNFTYNNGQDNVAPQLSNLVIPDSVAREESFTFSVTASDSNGLSDVEFVFFELFRPDSSQVESSPGQPRFLMHDDGNFEVFGDENADDGVYSFKNFFASTAPTGSWRFEFQVQDRGRLFSNKIIHNIIIQ